MTDRPVPPMDPGTGASTRTPSGPLVLDDPHETWLLRSGEMDLFVVPTDPEGRVGRRSFIGTVPAGSLLVGASAVPVDGLTWRLTAVGVEASLSRLDRQWVAALGVDPALQQGLHAWLTVTGSAVGGAGPRHGVDPGGPGPVDLAAGTVVNAPGGLAWVVPEGAELAVTGSDGGPAQPVAVPLGAGASVVVAEGGRVRVRSAAELGPADLAAGLRHSQDQTLLALAGLASAAGEQRRERRASRRAAHAATRARAFGALREIGGEQERMPASGEDPLLAACRLLGDVVGVTVTAPADWSVDPRADRVRAIARASGFRVRTVRLEGEWWRQGADPFVAFRTTDGSPVVLRPGASGGFRLLDPLGGAPRRVRADLAAELQETGYVFYRPLPAGPITVGRLLRHGLADSRRDLLTLLGFSLLIGLFSLAVPVGTGVMLGNLVPEGRAGPIVAIVVLLLAFVLAVTGFTLTRAAALLRLQGRMLGRMQSGLWDRLLALPVSFFGRHTVADIAQRLNGVETIQGMVSTSVSRTLLALVTMVFSTGLLFVYSVPLAFAVLGVTVVVLGLGALVSVAQVRATARMYQAKSRASGVLLQVVQGNEKIHAAAAEDRALHAWAVRFAQQSRAQLRMGELGAARTGLYAVLATALTIVVFGAVLRDPGSLTTAGFLSFIAALGQLAASTAQLDLGLGSALIVVAIFRALDPILAEAPEVSPDDADPGPLTGALALTAVTFAYPGQDRPVLEDLHLRVEPGEFLGIVGTSGSGKSTLVRLLLGFERPDSGSVTYDGVDLRTLDVRAVREQVGVVLQTPELVGADIFSVVAGDRPLTEDEVLAALDRVGMGAEVRALPRGVRTGVGDSGELLSGGQRQRIVLAAAVARSPRVVLLDEATSALDAVGQSVVADAFASLQVTRVVVAHRLGTVRDADRIVVLDGGRVVQTGTFDALSREDGLFREMVRRQAL